MAEKWIYTLKYAAVQSAYVDNKTLSPNETYSLKNRNTNLMNIQNRVNDTKYKVINQVLILPWLRGNVVEHRQ